MGHYAPSVGTEELGHMEMIAALVHQLTRELTVEQLKDSPFAPYFVDHTTAVYPTAASGFPWTAGSMQSTGDVITDLSEDMAADAATAQGQHFAKDRKFLIQMVLYGMTSALPDNSIH